MSPTFKTAADIKRNTRQRMQYIEIMAFYTGVVTRSDVAKSFGISDPAATKDLKLYSELAPDNLIYRHQVFGFIPTDNFQAMFADLSPEVVLPMIASNLAVVAEPIEELSIYSIPVESLPLPVRLPSKKVLAPIVRALKQSKQLRASYKSLSEREDIQDRLIEPHALVNTGLRWHVRAYCQHSYEFRDFVLSRFIESELVDVAAESSPMYDDDWTEAITVKLSPHPKLSESKRKNLLIDYDSNNDVIELDIRRALVGYSLHRLSVDTTVDHSLNPNAYQLVLINRDEIEPFAGWAFL